MKLNSLPFVSRPLIFTALIALVPTLLVAQGTLYISNIGDQGGSGSLSLYNTQWLTQGFETGNNPAGYTLNSVQVAMAAATGAPTGFTLSIYSTAGGVPSQSLGVLSGADNPSSADTYAYDATSITLAPSTEYFFVETATSTFSQGYYEWSQAFSAPTILDGWQIMACGSSADEGTDWSLAGRSALQFAIYATAVPEPSEWILLLAGGGVVLYRARRRNVRLAKTVG